MVVQTVAQETLRHGTENRLIEANIDLVKVDGHHAGECDICAHWANKVLSLTGATPGFPTVDQSHAAGMWHPHDRHAMFPYIPEYEEAA